MVIRHTAVIRSLEIAAAVAGVLMMVAEILIRRWFKFRIKDLAAPFVIRPVQILTYGPNQTSTEDRPRLNRESTWPRVGAFIALTDASSIYSPSTPKPPDLVTPAPSPTETS